jgi:hypothetical protein
MVMVSLFGVQYANAKTPPCPETRDFAPRPAVDGKCEPGWALNRKANICNSKFGVCNGFVWWCPGKNEHSQFQCDPPNYKPGPHCCRHNWGGEDGGDGKGTCHNWTARKTCPA